ncbi:MAG: hypothetical protein LBC13_00200 [Clostridiales bacterium]|jgi:ABC-type transport system involved in multi-copper enzyme maturation permease subunit|nr:hypothetical protein [Clostridiales bacterium]
MAALASLCTCLSFLSRSTGSAVTISLLVYFLFNLVVQMLSVFTETDLSLYTLSGVNGMASFYGGYTAGEILSIIFIPLVLTAAANAIGILSFEKRDIK